MQEVNDPAVIRRNRRMVSINGTIALDLYGQAMADAIGRRQYSGVGGHELFVFLYPHEQRIHVDSMLYRELIEQVRGRPVTEVT